MLEEEFVRLGDSVTECANAPLYAHSAYVHIVFEALNTDASRWFLHKQILYAVRSNV